MKLAPHTPARSTAKASLATLLMLALGGAGCGAKSTLDDWRALLADAATSTDAATASDAGALDGSDTSEPTSCPPSSGAACNDIANIGSPVTLSCVVGTPPTMSGGPVADGTYVITSATVYGRSCAGVTDTKLGAITVVIQGGCLQEISDTGGAQSFTFSVSGTNFTVTQTCPSSSTTTTTGQYQATPTTLTLSGVSSGMAVVETLTKVR